VARVEFLDDDQLVCTATAAPFACAYQPAADDVGSDTLVAVATDSAGQTATAVRVVRVDLFTAPLSARVTPARDTRAPFRFRTSGRLTLPPPLTSTQVCTAGQVGVQIKTGSRTLSTRRVNLRRDCTYVSTVTFSQRRRFGSATSLRFTARFLGNAVIKPATAVSRTARVR
jgi:hypothetical protein